MGNVIRIFFNNNRYEQSAHTGDPAIDNDAAIGYVLQAPIGFTVKTAPFDAVPHSQPNFTSSQGKTLLSGMHTVNYICLSSDGTVWYCVGPQTWIPAYDVTS